MSKPGYVYILASHRNRTLYVGIMSNLAKRVWEHKQDLVGRFTKRYQVHQLVYCGMHQNIRDAIQRERQMKK